jgi:hypothetical protein
MIFYDFRSTSIDFNSFMKFNEFQENCIQLNRFRMILYQIYRFPIISKRQYNMLNQKQMHRIHLVVDDFELNSMNIN